VLRPRGTGGGSASGTRGKEEFADFAAPGIDGNEKCGCAGFVAGGGEGRIGVKERPGLGKIVGADGIEEGLFVGHGLAFLGLRSRGTDEKSSTRNP
jgi:hypothetical protein